MEEVKKWHLFQSLVIHKTGGIFRDFQLPFLDVFAELPGKAS
jgi:hypothetical protein